MAIINTFQRCLESRYLVEDASAADRVGELLARAGDRLEGAANIQRTGQGDPTDAVVLSYEAMFCGLRALIYARGYREMGLGCLMLACETLYIKTGELDPEHLRRFERVQLVDVTGRCSWTEGSGHCSGPSIEASAGLALRALVAFALFAAVGHMTLLGVPALDHMP